MSIYRRTSTEDKEADEARSRAAAESATSEPSVQAAPDSPAVVAKKPSRKPKKGKKE